VTHCENFLYLIQADGDGKRYIVLEYAEGGTLCNYLAKNFGSLTRENKYNLGLDITNGLRHLHSLDIVHKDLVFIVFKCIVIEIICYITNPISLLCRHLLIFSLAMALQK